MERYAAYCAAVCRFVRNPFARRAIAAELTAHLEDRAQALTASGSDTEEAPRLAVEAMGDPEETGRALDRVHSPILYGLYRVIRPLALLSASVLALTLALDAMSGGTLLHFPQLFAPPSEITYDLSSGNMTLVRVTGGGRLGDYQLTPVETAYLTRLSDGADPQYILTVYFHTSHLQPWLGDLRTDCLTLTGPDGVSRSDAHLLSHSQSRMTGVHSIFFPALSPSDFPFTLSLSALDRAVTFTLRLEGALP